MKDRVAQAMARLGISQAELESRAKLGKGYASKILGGERKRLGPEMMSRIAAALDVKAEWLATGAGEMARTGETAPQTIAHITEKNLRTVLDWHENAGRWSAAAISGAIGMQHKTDAPYSQADWMAVLDELDALVRRMDKRQR